MIDYKNAILKITGLVVILIVLLFAIWLSIYFWPFLIGGLIAAMAEPLIRKAMTKLKLSRKVAGFTVIVIIYLILALLLGLGIYKLTKEAIAIATDLPNIYQRIVESSQNTFSEIIKFYDNLPEGVASKIYEVMMNILNGAGQWTSSILDKLLNFAMLIPNMFIYIGVTFLSSIFIAMDRRTITTFLQDNFPRKWVKNILNLIQVSMGSLINYLRAQLVLACITFIQLFIAFIILKQPYSLTLALAISLVDALPILGTGTVMIPWAIYSALTGNMSFGIGLMIAYVIIIIVRQLIEPRIVSSNVGVHPLITLLSMYLGFKLFGVLGMIFGPIIMIVLKDVFSAIFSTGYIKKIFVRKKEIPNKT